MAFVGSWNCKVLGYSDLRLCFRGLIALLQCGLVVKFHEVEEWLLAALGISLSSKKKMKTFLFSRPCISELFSNETVTYHESQGTV